MLRITPRELTLAVVIAIMGFIFSTRSFILYMDKQTPVAGLLIYEVILYVALFFFSNFLGVAVFHVKPWSVNLIQTLGLLLITFAFFVVVDWSSAYQNIVTKGTSSNVSNIYFQCEDGATWYAWSHVTSSVETLRMLTYVITPFVLALIGGFLVRGKLNIL